MSFSTNVSFANNVNIERVHLLPELSRFINSRRREHPELMDVKTIPILPWIIDMVFTDNKNNFSPIMKITIKEKVSK